MGAGTFTLTATATDTVTGQLGKGTAAFTVGSSYTKTYGVSYPALLSLSAVEQASQLADMKAIGLTSVRIDADWSVIQPAGPTTFNWSQEDQAVHSILAAGMTVDLLIDGCAPWAGNGNEWSAPNSVAAFATYARQVASRYAPLGVHTFEVWNEPNISVFWQPKPNPAAYTALLIAAYTAIKAADPASFVISAGLSPAATDGINYNPRDFLTIMYQKGVKGHMDAVGIHPYCYPALPATFESWSAWEQMNMTNPSINSVLAANGDSARLLWLTEFGAPDTGPDGVGAQAQSDAITQAVQLTQTRPWIGALYIYTWSDAGQASIDGSDTFGLVTASGAHKPAWSAVKTGLGH